MENWTTLITFNQPHEAHLASGVLESQGIQTIIKDELTVQAHNFYSNAIGGVKVQIRESDATKALSIMKESGYIYDNAADLQNSPELVTLNSGMNKTTCPFCNSHNIGRKREVNILTVVVYSLLGVFFPIFKRSYICYNCNKTWKFIKPK